MIPDRPGDKVVFGSMHDRRHQARHDILGDAVVFAVRYDDPDEAPLRELMARYHAAWPIVDDSQAKVDWGVAGIPESYLVDPNGVVLSRIVGGVNADALEVLLGRAKAVESPGQGQAGTP